MSFISTNGVATNLLFEDGSWAHTAGLPEQLYNFLSNPDSSPAYVSIGTSHRYYIKFADGTSEWSGPDEIRNTILKYKESARVKTVAFGKYRKYLNLFFIIFTNDW